MLLAQLKIESLNLNLTDTGIAIGISLIASIIVYLMYHLFYGRQNIGAGVDRAFILGGPAITALFLGIQCSIPLSLGLLGALSFVRFRTPVKDSAEIGFLLLLIASSIGIATGTYAIVVFLFLAALIALTIQHLIRNRFSLRRYANLVISIDRDFYGTIEEGLNKFLGERLDNVNMKTLSVMDGRVSMHYQFRKRPSFSRTEFVQGLNNLTGTGKAEIFLGLPD
ncbi:MAG: DUF4956 domain-containing protein [Phycisphaerae bacterium]|nr:DUF4956 domain-containing protein [Phycisphaerae bacterium]